LMGKASQSSLKFQNCHRVYISPHVFLHWCEIPVVKCIFSSSEKLRNKGSKLIQKQHKKPAHATKGEKWL